MVHVGQHIYIGGARVWAEWSPYTTPRYTLFEVVGIDSHGGYYVFRNRKSRITIGYTVSQLTQLHARGTFSPFCIDPSVEHFVEVRPCR